MMKVKLLFFLLFFIINNVFCQKILLKIESKETLGNLIIDSIGFKKNHTNDVSAESEVHLFSNNLIKKGYLENKAISYEKVNDTLIYCDFYIGKKTKLITIKIKKEIMNYINIAEDSLKIELEKSELFLKEILQSLENKGFSNAKVKLQNFKFQNKNLTSSLHIDFEKKRIINDIYFVGYDTFSEGFKKNIKKHFQNKIYNQNSVLNINNEINQIKFIKQKKYPEVLFTIDSTKLFIYVEKSNSNSFDGFIGFNNDENSKLIINGYLDLILNNILNSGESFSILWKSDGKDQKTFNLNFELPYIFKTPFILKTQLNIFRQDSLFQNTKTNIELGYLLDYNKRLYLGFNSSESSDIQSTNSNLLSDFKNEFTTVSFDYFKKSDEAIFFEKTKCNIKFGVGNRNSNFSNNKQYFFDLNASHIFNLNKTNSIFVNLLSYYLKSDNYIINELFRFGGIKSIRGFNENNLQANFINGLSTEYRYSLSQNLYLNSILDYYYYEDNTSKSKINLFSTGLGLGIKTKTGLFKIIYANGNSTKNNIKFSKSIIHVSLQTFF